MLKKERGEEICTFKINETNCKLRSWTLDSAVRQAPIGVGYWHVNCAQINIITFWPNTLIVTRIANQCYF